MKTLDQIAQQFQTDRSSTGWHSYMNTYAEFFEPFRHDPVVMMEMGVLGGGGIQTWAEYFTHPAAKIIGIDIELFRCVPITDPRVTLKQGSQSDKPFLDTLPEEFDIIIDDGGHFASDQFTSFFHLWPRIKPGGIYACEDLHVYSSPQHSNAHINIMQFLAQIQQEMQGQGGLAQARPDPANKWNEIDTVTVRRGLALFKKRK